MRIKVNGLSWNYFYLLIIDNIPHLFSHVHMHFVTEMFVAFATFVLFVAVCGAAPNADLNLKDHRKGTKITGEKKRKKLN